MNSTPIAFSFPSGPGVSENRTRVARQFVLMVSGKPFLTVSSRSSRGPIRLPPLIASGTW
jgi:hypothetical protein